MKGKGKKNKKRTLHKGEGKRQVTLIAENIGCEKWGGFFCREERKKGRPETSRVLKGFPNEGGQKRSY